MATVKAFANEHYEWTRYREKTNEVAHTAIKGRALPRGFFKFHHPWSFWRCGGGDLEGQPADRSGAINSGELFSFVLYSSFIGGSIGGMADVYAKIQKAIVRPRSCSIFLKRKKSLCALNSMIGQNNH